TATRKGLGQGIGLLPVASDPQPHLGIGFPFEEGPTDGLSQASIASGDENDPHGHQ
ncbi:MAG: hypothetical protein RIS76_2533, partial [Verrucomicrobiota bacterium]